MLMFLPSVVGCVFPPLEPGGRFVTVSTCKALVEVTTKTRPRTLPPCCEEAQAATGKTKHKDSG